jgi:hypothetical protein
MLLYHVHFDVPDVPAAEARYAADGFVVVARFGYAGREETRFGPEVSYEELRARGVRLRLVELERGAVNVVLMQSRFPEARLGQVGVLVDAAERERAVARAATLGLHTRDRGARLFVATGQSFDLELTDAARHPYDAAALAALRLASLDVACADPAAAATLARQLRDDATARRLRFAPGPAGWAELRAWGLVEG